jgi:hypothetical protein
LALPGTFPVSFWYTPSVSGAIVICDTTVVGVLFWPCAQFSDVMLMIWLSCFVIFFLKQQTDDMMNYIFCTGMRFKIHYEIEDVE